MTKQFLSVILAFFMVINTLPAAAVSAVFAEGEGDTEPPVTETIEETEDSESEEETYQIPDHSTHTPHLYRFAPQPEHFSRQFGVVSAFFDFSYSRRKNAFVTPASMKSQGKISFSPRSL